VISAAKIKVHLIVHGVISVSRRVSDVGHKLKKYTAPLHVQKTNIVKPTILNLCFFSRNQP